MAETTEFNHDQLGHILTDHLVQVPRFQRSYAWAKDNVDEYLSDLEAARDKGVQYFMGTLVFAKPDGAGDRRQIVDGQQRLATTAVLIIAIRDLLAQYGKREQPEKTEQRYLRRYVLKEESEAVTLILSPKDQDSRRLASLRGSPELCDLGQGLSTPSPPNLVIAANPSPSGGAIGLAVGSDHAVVDAQARFDLDAPPSPKGQIEPSTLPLGEQARAVCSTRRGRYCDHPSARNGRGSAAGAGGGCGPRIATSSTTRNGRSLIRTPSTFGQDAIVSGCKRPRAPQRDGPR